MASVGRCLRSNVATHGGFRAVLITKHLYIIGISHCNLSRVIYNISFTPRTLLLVQMFNDRHFLLMVDIKSIIYRWET